MTSKLFPAAGLLFLILFHGVLLFRWVGQDNRTLAWDQSIHTQIAFEYKDRLAEGGMFNFLKPVFSSYPPLYHVSLIPFLGRTADIADAGAALNFIYLIVFLLSVYFIGRTLMGPLPSFTAALLVSCYPIMIDMSRQTMIDYALTAWVAASVLCLLKSGDFQNPPWSAAFGMAFGLGLLVKWTMAAYLLGPMVPSVVRAFKTRRTRWLWISLALAGVIVAPWYMTNGLRMISRIQHLSGLIPASGVEFKGWSRFLWYPVGLFHQLNLLFVLFLVPGLLLPFWRPKFWPIALWFYVSFFLFSLIRNHNIRYTMPALPAAAILSVAWIPEFRRWLFIAMNAAALAFVGVFYFGPPREIMVPIGRAHLDIFRALPPYPGLWPHRDIIEKVRELKGETSRPTRVLVVSNAAHLHSSTLDTSAKAQGVADIAFKGVSKSRWFDFAEFILLKTGDLGPRYSTDSIQKCADLINSRPAWFTASYKEKARWRLPDDSEAVLFRFDPRLLPAFDAGALELSLKEMSLPKLKLTGVTIQAVPGSRDMTGRGKLKELLLRSKKIETKDVDLENVRFRLQGPQINLPYFQETGEIQVVSLEAVEVDAQIRAEPFLKLARRKAPWLKNPVLEFNGPRLKISGKIGFVPVLMEATVKIENGMLLSRLEILKVGGVPFPLILIRALTDQEVELASTPQKPFGLGIRSIEGRGDTLRIAS